ncbi:MAG: PrsW family intramembrane metalloprotease [Spirochaetaceae bacterium]
MNYLLLNLFLAALPSVVLLYYFNHRDRRKPEPLGLIFRVFLLGIAIVIPAGLIEFLLDVSIVTPSPLLTNFFRAFIVAAFVEEGLKLFVVKNFVFDKPEFDKLTDGIIYTITAGLGFAFFENIFYSVGGPATLILRGFTAVPLHAAASGIMGYYVGIAKFQNGAATHRGLLYAVLVHGLYNFFLFQGGFLSFLTVPLLIASFWRLLRLYREAERADKKYGRDY